ncbi:hypothetical protein Pse7367_0981 [Thalassoporum mexicanum PCC 7367]|uniref:C39 family peptidase n=1 Tax=Thalassoporum mexicanum TaxID=3457544 RepID=UPI00029FBF72|nr:C39 family peptidase [Pseudanabaena sp. PCC 7367]AFY69280.1 hypothetical protein Pse7367_0981 [Pseudanabaena sp. PCC 7367]
MNTADPAINPDPANTTDPNATKPLSISQYPTEVMVHQPTIIAGLLDTTRVAEVTVKAEDRFPLPVEIDPVQGKWSVNLSQGFLNPGARWLGIKGSDRQGNILTEEIISINVLPLLATLTVKQDTVFKKSTIDSTLLLPQEKAVVKEGKMLVLKQYGFVDGHLKVKLLQDIEPVGKFGFFYGPHVELHAPAILTVEHDTLFKVAAASASELSDDQKTELEAGYSFTLEGYRQEGNHYRVQLDMAIAPVGAQGYFYAPHVRIEEPGKDDTPDGGGEVPTENTILTITHDTYFKKTTANSTELGDGDKFLVKSGSAFRVKGYACGNGHFKVRLYNQKYAEGVVGYFYWQHVRMTKDGKEIPYNPDMKTITIKQGTLFKQQPIAAGGLGGNQKVELKAGEIFGVSSYGIDDNHYKLELTEAIDPLGTSGFVYQSHATLKQGNEEIDPDRRVLGVPYFSQRDNPRDPYTTCNVTAIGMILAYHGLRSKRSGQQLEDELYQWIIDRYGAGARTDNFALQQLYRAYGFGGGFDVARTWSQVAAELDANRPLTVGGYFTAGGHIITVIGYEPRGFVVHDPYGDARTGYAKTEGRSLIYSYNYMRQMCGRDGDVWAHFIVPK